MLWSYNGFLNEWIGLYMVVGTIPKHYYLYVQISDGWIGWIEIDEVEHSFDYEISNSLITF